MSSNAIHRALILGVSLLIISCTGIDSWIQRPHCPVVPVPTGDLPNDVDLRAQMHFSIEGREARFEAVARQVSEELVVVGIAKYGVRLFAVHQRGREIEVEGAPSREFEYLARWTVDALHRAIWIPTRSDADAGQVVSWSRERREFARLGTSESVVVRFDTAPTEVGYRVEIQNPWCGYEATFVVVGAMEQTVQ